MTSPDDVFAPALSDVRPGATWPWWALAVGAALVVAGGLVFTPADSAPPSGVDQPASLAVPVVP